VSIIEPIGESCGRSYAEHCHTAGKGGPALKKFSAFHVSPGIDTCGRNDASRRKN